MNFDYLKDINYTKAILGMNDTELSSFLNISRMTLRRWKKKEVTPDYATLEMVYNIILENGIHLNKVKEEMYASSLRDNHKLLFHGAKTELIGDSTIERSEINKDFGKGFYLGETFDQSASFVVGYNYSSIYVFDFDKTDINIKEFSISEEWMILIAYFRGRLEKYKDSKYLKQLIDGLKNIDVVIAPIADNTMYTILDDFISGKITDLQCLNALSANRLGKQYVFLNDSTIKNNLKSLERCFYCKKEREEYKTHRLKENEIGKSKVILALREYAGKGKYIEELLK